MELDKNGHFYIAIRYIIDKGYMYKSSRVQVYVVDSTWNNDTSWDSENM